MQYHEPWSRLLCWSIPRSFMVYTYCYFGGRKLQLILFWPACCLLASYAFTFTHVLFTSISTSLHIDETVKRQVRYFHSSSAFIHVMILRKRTLTSFRKSAFKIGLNFGPETRERGRDPSFRIIPYSVWQPCKRLDSISHVYRAN